MAASIMTLSGVKVSASIQASAQNVETAEITNATVSINSSAAINFTAGFTADTAVADHIMARTYAIAGGANEDIDLSSAWTNAFGDAVALLRIKGIMVKNVSVNTDAEMHVGEATGGNDWVAWCAAAGDTVRVQTGGVFLLCSPGNATDDGYAVGAGATDTLRIANDGGAAGIVEVTILGVTGV